MVPEGVLLAVTFVSLSETVLTHVETATTQTLVHHKFNVRLARIASHVELSLKRPLEEIVVLGCTQAFFIDFVKLCAEGRLQNQGFA